jgi:hypothetical protein
MSAGCFQNVWLPLKTDKNFFLLGSIKFENFFQKPFKGLKEGILSTRTYRKPLIFCENISTKPLMTCPIFGTFSCIYERGQGLL